MPLWKLKHNKPVGAIPGGFATIVGVSLFSLIFAVYFLSISLTGNGEQTEDAPDERNAEPPGLTAFRSSQKQIGQESERIQQIRAAQARDRLRREEDERRQNRFGAPAGGNFRVRLRPGNDRRGVETQGAASPGGTRAQATLAQGHSSGSHPARRTGGSALFPPP